MNTTDSRWFDDRKEVLRLARWLVEQRDWSVLQVIDYFEKPWKWDAQYCDMTETRWATPSPTVHGEEYPY
jgi:hypothetical protein